MANSKHMATQGLHETLVRMVEDAKLQGVQFRFVEATATAPRQWAPVDHVMWLTGLNQKEANRALNRAIAAAWPATKPTNQRTGSDLTSFQPTNQRTGSDLTSFQPTNQRPDFRRNRFGDSGIGQLVAPGEYLIPILTHLPNHHPRVAAFIKAVNDTATRYLGGDTSMAEELHEIRAVQEQLPHDHPARAMGEAVETGRVGRLNAVPGASASALEWHQKREESKEANKQKSQAIKQRVPGANPGDYKRNNATICRTVTGHAPKQFKQIAGLKNYRSARDGMTTGQLGVVTGLEEMAADMAGPGFEPAFNQATNMIAEGFKLGGMHGKFLQGGPPGGRSGRQIEDKKEAKTASPPAPQTNVETELEKRPVIIQKTINQYFTNATNVNNN